MIFFKIIQAQTLQYKSGKNIVANKLHRMAV